jgi:Flp pilus assembly protein TadB
LPELLEQLRASVQGGLDVGEALAVLASSGPPALRPELALLRLDLRLVGLPEALRRAMDRWSDAYFRRAAEALILNDRLGGQHVGTLLEELAAAARAEAGARAEGKARQAEMVLTTRVVALLPFGVLLALRQLNPAYVEPYATPQGQLVLGVVAALVLGGHVLMRRAARLPGDDHGWGGQA